MGCALHAPQQVGVPSPEAPPGAAMGEPGSSREELGKGMTCASVVQVSCARGGGAPEPVCGGGLPSKEAG